MKMVTIFLSGLLFAVGLGVSGMTMPSKVVGFLDFFGAWDPSLAFVMVGAILVNLVGLRLTLKTQAKPLFATQFGLPSRRDITARLLGGATLFGLGWGLGGFCPGPALASLTTGMMPVFVFVIMMLAGMVLFSAVDKALEARKS